ALVIAGLLLTLSLLPSLLRKRAEAMAHAWLARDTDSLKQFIEPSQAENVTKWFEKNLPPDLPEQPAPEVQVTVQRNDGTTAEVLIQIKTTEKNGKPAYYVFQHHWFEEEDNWYFRAESAAPVVRPKKR